MTDFGQLSSREEVIETLTSTMSNTKRRMTEIRGQIDNMKNSVDREQGRYASLVSELRTIKDNLDTVPREDIRDKYEEALEVRHRLATMRAQAEKFEANYEFLEGQQQLFGQILSALQGVEFLPADEEGANSAAGHGPLDVVGIIRAQEDERRRLARTMHDGPAQSLTNFILQAEICQRLFDRDPERAAQELTNLKSDASKTFQKIRDFIFDLRPMMLEDLGVAPTVRRYTESYSEKNDIQIKLSMQGEDRRLEDHREVMLFRSLQDLLALARDYANPDHIEIQLDLSSNPARLQVEDDGNGFDASVLEGQLQENYKDARAQGLAMLRSKFELIGGKVRVRSSDDGTIVQIELPTS